MGVIGGSPVRIELADLFFSLAASARDSWGNGSTANATFLTLVLSEAGARESVVILGFRVARLGVVVVGATPVRLG